MRKPIRQPLPCISDVLLPIAGAPAHARNVVTQGCLQWELPHLLAPASLIAGELVANAVQHAGTMMDLHVALGHRHLIIEVVDGSSDRPVLPHLLTSTAQLHHPGLNCGLLLVDATADRWGSWVANGGKMTWAALRYAR